MNLKFYKKIQFDIFTEERDRWIGVFLKRQELRESDCKYIQTTYHVCLIPCIVIKFTRNKFFFHKKGCYHSV